MFYYSLFFFSPLCEPFSGQRTLEEFEQHLKEQEERRDDAAAKLERASHVLVSVKAGVEHLADKLQHLKIVSHCSQLLCHRCFGAFPFIAF